MRATTATRPPALDAADRLEADPFQVSPTVVADGLLVRLSGNLSSESAVAQLRRALLRPLPDACHDVIIDAGAVTDLDEAAVAVLLAAKDWVRSGKRRFALSRTSPALDEALRAAKLTRALPKLGRPRRGARVPSQQRR